MGVLRASGTHVCSVKDCERPVNANGLCKTHARRLREKGDVLANVQSEPPKDLASSTMGTS